MDAVAHRRHSRRPRVVIAAVAVVLAAIASIVVYRVLVHKPEVYSTVMPAGGIFGSQSVWRQDISDAPVRSDSQALVSTLVSQITPNYGGNAILNVSGFNMSYYQVESGVPRHDVVFDDCQGKGSTPPQLSDPKLNEPFSDVPVPSNAGQANGTDGELSVYDPSTDQLWELWQAHKVGDRWHACWGGRIDDASSSTAVFPWPMGVSASGLSLTGGVLGIREARRGVIDHALYLTVLQAANYEEFSYPANRSDGSQPVGTPGAIEEGQRFRLDPTIDVKSLGLTPIATAIATAAQKYGFIVSDVGGSVAVDVESGAGYVRQHGGPDPWTKLLGGVPEYSVLANFPWDRLQALPHDYGKP